MHLKAALGDQRLTHRSSFFPQSLMTPKQRLPAGSGFKSGDSPGRCPVHRKKS
jgi:hypothetical protein